jgi:DNA-binding FadR family transcriptional regulator
MGILISGSETRPMKEPRKAETRALREAAARGAHEKAPKVAETIARQLRSRIVRGELKEGDALPPEAELMAQFAISRATLREALRILESESLLTVKRGLGGGPRVHLPNRANVVRHFGLFLQAAGTTLADVYAARLLVEPTLAKQLAIEQGPRAAAELRKLTAALREKIDGDIRLAAELVHFHERIAELAGNQTLLLFMQVINAIKEQHSSALAKATGDMELGAASVKHALAAQEKLVGLIDAGKGDEAEAFWHMHLDKVAKIVFRNPRFQRAIDVLD